MMTLRTFPRHLALAGMAATALFASTAQAASISFTEQLNGPVLVSHDNNDWKTFNFTSTNNTATADATLLQFSDQGSAGDGTEVIFLKDNSGHITDLLTAAVHIIDAGTYSVHYEFFTDNALPAVIPHSTGKYTDVIATGASTYVGLQTFSQGIGVTTVAVPEPESAAMMLLGLGAMGLVARRRKTQ